MKERLRKLILRWLFDTDNINDYQDLLVDNIDTTERLIKEFNAHINTMKKYRADLILIKKLVKVCENHGIDAGKEIKDIKLGDEEIKNDILSLYKEDKTYLTCKELPNRPGADCKIKGIGCENNNCPYHHNNRDEYEVLI